MKFNTQYSNTKKALVEIINNSGLPIAATFSILENLYRETEKLYQIALKQEAEVEEQQNNEVEDV